MEQYSNIIAQLALALGASWCAGINLYATIGMLGLMSRFAGFELPPGLEVLNSEWVIGAAILMYCVEFFADKIPAIDTAWDSIHTFIRIPAGAVLAATALGEVRPELQVAAALIGGTLALGSHTTKATARVAAHATGTSPIVSPAASLVEDGLVVTTIAFLAAYPLVTLSLTAAMVVGSAVMLYFMWNVVRRVFRSLFKQSENPILMPPPPPTATA